MLYLNENVFSVIWSEDGATVIVFQFGDKPQFSPASRCCSCALPLSVQECVDCITSVILPAARKQLGPRGLGILFSVRN